MNADSDLSLDQLVQLEQMEHEAEADAAAPDDGSGTQPTDDETIVLPWWQHPVNVITLVVTAAILAGMVGWMVGDNDGSAQHNDVDTGFLQDMRVHHEQAVLMSIIYRNLPDTDPGLRTVARQIVVGQNIEIGRMIQLLRTFGESEVNDGDTAMVWMGMVSGIDSMPGMATDAELDLLGTLEGREADELFVELMTAHHIGGIEMAQFAAENGENPEVVKMATGMAEAQAGEIGEMQRLLE